MNPLAVILLLAATLALASCGKTPLVAPTAQAPALGGGPSPAGAASAQVAIPQADHPCQLLTNDDAEAVIGKLQRAAPLDDSEGGAHTCTWESQGGHLTLYTATSADGVAFLQSQFGAAGGSPNVPVPGVGDQAGWLQAGGYMLVQKGPTTFAIGIAGPAATLEAGKTLALKVIASL
jgi:hypothetical protein